MPRIFSVVLACLLMMSAGAVEAANNTASYNRLADRYKNAVPAYQQQEDTKEEQNDRYVKLLSDDSFAYYMDKKSAKWIQCPNTSDEYIIDVWVKMVQLESGNNADLQYSYPSKYYLEHYYIRPTTQQIQFLSELEVTGRPDNNIQERSYDEANWEKLVPESIEDSIYQAVVKKMGGVKKAKGKSRSIKDTLDEVFNVAI